MKKFHAQKSFTWAEFQKLSQPQTSEGEEEDGELITGTDA